MAAHFTSSYAGIGAMLRADFMQDEMLRRARRAKDAAEADAPVGPEDDLHRGRYKASFTVDSGIRTRKTSRAYGRVTNSAPEALDVEFGSENNPAHHTLARAIDAVKD